MSGINGVNGTGAVNQTEQVDSGRTERTSHAPPAAGAAASAKFSKAAELFGKLMKLQQQDPERLKDVATKIAAGLREAANEPGAPTSFLEKLAAGFDEVAKTGDLSALRQKGGVGTPAVSGHHHHRHHHHHGTAPAGAASALAEAVDQVDQALSTPASPTSSTPTPATPEPTTPAPTTPAPTTTPSPIA